MSLEQKKSELSPEEKTEMALQKQKNIRKERDVKRLGIISILNERGGLFLFFDRVETFEDQLRLLKMNLGKVELNILDETESDESKQIALEFLEYIKRSIEWHEFCLSQKEKQIAAE